MPRIQTPKDKLASQEQLPPGIYDFTVKEFKPATSKKGGSVNLNPYLRITNHPTLNDRAVFENLNSQAWWVQEDFCHALGVPMEDDGSGGMILPGKFICKQHGEADCKCDPKDNWMYQGPLVGRVGKLEIAMGDNGKGGMVAKVKRYICAVPGCQERHRESLLSAA